MYDPYQNFIQQTTQGRYPQQFGGFNGNQYPQQQAPQPTPQVQDIIQVNGVEGAKAFQMQPNGRVMLLDSNDPIVYIKSSDGAGFPTLNAYHLTPYEQKKEETAENKLEKKINELEKRLEEYINEQSTIARNNATNGKSNNNKSNGRNSSSTTTVATDGATD